MLKEQSEGTTAEYPMKTGIWRYGMSIPSQEYPPLSLE